MKGHNITPRFAEKAFDNPKYPYNFYFICNHNITQYVSYRIGMKEGAMSFCVSLMLSASRELGTQDICRKALRVLA